MSQALLAVALTVSPSEWCKSKWKIQPSEVTKLLFSDKNMRYDFGKKDVVFGDKEFGDKLSDDDLGAILGCAFLQYMAGRSKFG